MGINITISCLAHSIAEWYQGEAQSGAVQEEKQKDFPRVLYNVKQIAFNAATVSAIATAIFTIIGRVALPYGILMTGLFWAARMLVQKATEEMLLEASKDSLGSLAQGSEKCPSVPTLENSVAIGIHINSNRGCFDSPKMLCKNWRPVAYRIQDIPVWRNLILSEDLT